MPHHETDIELRAIIISLKKTGNFTISQISRITNRPPSTISTITGRYQRYGTLNNSIRSGRPKNPNARQERHLLLLARKHRFTSARQLLSWASLSGRISADTASRIFRRNNLTSRRPQLKLFLKPGHRTARLQCGKIGQQTNGSVSALPTNQHSKPANQTDLKEFADILESSTTIIVSFPPSKVAVHQPASGML